MTPEQRTLLLSSVCHTRK